VAPGVIPESGTPVGARTLRPELHFVVLIAAWLADREYPKGGLRKTTPLITEPILDLLGQDPRI
jgi:hypothetical protein